ncbi:unnamed protein product [Cuscuta epithymum]|uniref:Uncharacterized protein n=1 Tax=Cuscuta epithymum TaxID=186058 RepID=A0AAV0DMN2_9ASTE|nr:unnamed protein product [Cuscuta epithymum]
MELGERKGEIYQEEDESPLRLGIDHIYTHTPRKYNFTLRKNKRAEEKRGSLHIFGYFSVTELFLSRALPLPIFSLNASPVFRTIVATNKRRSEGPITWCSEISNMIISIYYIIHMTKSKDVKANLPGKTNPLGIL